MGIMLELNLKIVGSSASSGKNLSINDRASRISLAASFEVGFPFKFNYDDRNVIARNEELTSLMSLMLDMASSMGLLMFVSISEALAPAYCVKTVIAGNSISGYKSTGSFTSE
jgi:hypothetical protein